MIIDTAKHNVAECVDLILQVLEFQGRDGGASDS